jgi:hypothetical protein
LVEGLRRKTMMIKKTRRIDNVETTIDSRGDAFPALIPRPDVRAYAVSSVVVAFLLTVFTMVLPAAA